MPYLGAHMSIAGGVYRALERGLSIGCEAVQMFVKSNNRWQSPPIKQQDAIKFREIYAENFAPSTVFAHTAYLINLAAPADELWNKSIDAMKDELARCAQIGIDKIVLHIGSHTGSGEQAGLDRVCMAFDRIFSEMPDNPVMILMETTAGQGTNLGYKFEHFQYVYEHVKEPERLGICLDTCHMFAAGYDLRNPEIWNSMMEQMDSLFGIDKIKAVHLNDSVKGLGEKKDRHAHIGKGMIGLEGFRNVLNDERLASLPMVLETPKGPDLKEDVENLKVLRSLLESK